LKTLGIIGGIAPESTIDYYRTIIDRHRQRSGGGYPSVIINSIDLRKLLRLVGEGRLDELADDLLAEIGRLAAAGADLGLLASNTPHIVFDELRARSPIPLISIVESTFRAAAAAGLRRLALFGTRFTMSAGFYASFFEPRGISVLPPAPAEQERIHTIYMEELVNAQFLDRTREELLAVAGRMKGDLQIDGVILGGTELPLLLRDASWNGLQLLNTGHIHAEQAVEQMLAEG
jgi:aspartate racemase